MLSLRQLVLRPAAALCAALAFAAAPAVANTVVNLGTVSQITGPQDLDLTGEFIYAINFSANDPPRIVSGVTFLPDTQAIAGAVLYGPNNVTPWQNRPEFGASADANELEEILHDIRWAIPPDVLSAQLAVTAGERYKLQVLVSGNGFEDRKWDIRVNGLDAVDEFTSLGASPGQSYSQNRATLYSYEFIAPSGTVTVQMGNLFGGFEGGDRNPIWQALTLERIFIPPTPDDVLISPSQFFAVQTAPVGTFQVIDRKSPPVSHTVAFVAGAGGADNAKFTISGAQLLPQPFNFSGQPAGTIYSIRVRATDTADANRFIEKALTVSIATPQAPTAVTIDATAVSKVGQPGMLVGNLDAADPNSFDQHTFALVAGAGSTHNALFTVAGSELRFAQIIPAGTTSVSVRLRATDLAGLTVETALTLPVVDPQLRINELLSGNSTGLIDESLQPQDWLEIYNMLPQSVDVAGWYLTDDANNLTKWQFPSRVIPPNGYLALFCDGRGTPPAGSSLLHTNFSLGSGERVLLVKPDGVTIASELNPLESFPNVTYGWNAAGTQSGYLVTPTPGAVNSALAVYGKNTVAFSRPHGFYTNGFSLTLTATAPGSTIRYTLDGSKPTATTGSVYGGPVSIFPDTNGTTRGTRIVRAIAVNSQAAYAPVATQTFLFINGTGIPTYNGVVGQTNFAASITGNPAYGPLLDDALMALPVVSVILPAGLSTSEAEASVELFHPTGAEAGFQIVCGVNATGTTSLGSPKLSMSAKFRGQYGQSKLEYPVYGLGSFAPPGAATEFKELRLRSHSHDTFFWLGTAENPPVPYGYPPVTRSGDAQIGRNLWIEEMQLLMGQPGKRGRQAHLYLNGAYHGIYHIQEHADEDFMASYYPGGGEDFHFTGAATTGSDHGNGDTWTVPWSALKNSLGNYTEAKRWVDVTNLADYMVLSFYAGNDWDWSAQHNWGAAGPKLPDQGGWKFFQQDSDIALQDVNADCTDQNVPDGIFYSLMTYPDFRVLFRDRAYQHCFHNGRLTPANAGALYDARMTEIFTAVIAESARWQPSSSVSPLPWDRNEEWTNEWNYLRNTFFPGRTSILIDQLRAHPGWWPVEPAEMNQHGGAVPSGFVVTLAAPAGEIYYTTDGSDPRLPGGAISPTAQLAGGGTVTTTLVPATSTWRFLDDGSDQATAWRVAGYNDTAWRSGPAEIGYGDGDEVTVANFIDTDPVVAGVQKNITTYFRKTFNVANPGDYTGLKIRLRRDDGAVVYLNGQELWRPSMPAGTITRDTPANIGAGGADESTFFEQVLGAGQFTLLASGNVLAVEIHQNLNTSSDISFDLELQGLKPLAPQSITINNPTLLRARAYSGGDWSALNEASFTLSGTVPATFANFSVSEIHYHPHDIADTEFIEFVNTSAGYVDANGVIVTGGVEFVFPLGSVLAPGERIVAVKNAALFDARYRTPGSPWYRAGIRVAGAWSGSLNNGGEQLQIFAASNAALATFSYEGGAGWPGRADGNGSSLEVGDPSGVPSSSAAAKGAWLGTGANWRASSEFHGSPGAAGLGPDNRVVINEILSASLPPATDAIELLNTIGSEISMGGWFLSDSSANYKKYRVPAATTIGPGAYLVLGENDFNNLANPACLVPFALNGDGGDDLYLIEADAGGNLLRFVDRAEFGPAPGGLTFGRWPNASGTLDLMSTSTLGAANSGVLPGYGAWVAATFAPGSPSTLTAPGANPDGDALTNWGEFVFMQSALVPDGPVVRIYTGPGAGGYFAIQYRRQPSGSGLIYVVSVSANLATWNDTPDTLQTLSEIPQPDGSVLVTVRLIPGSPGRRFLRVEASLQL